MQLNNGLTKTIEEWEKQSTDTLSDRTSSLDYLKSIGLYPTTQPTEEFFNGQFLSSIILSHIDIENEMNLFTKQSKLSSFSCEFHPTTFTYLFNIIKQLTTTSESNNTVIHILTICLRLSATNF
jgi:hypothetical protein